MPMHITWKFRTILLLCVSLLSLQILSCTSSERPFAPPLFIAHAGGGIDGQTYTNTLEALNTNYKKGFRCFEIDFSWTADGELVAIHDWYDYDTFEKNYSVPDELKGKIPTKAQFLRLKTKTGLTPLSLESVLKWTAKKRDAFIVTDVKEENIKALGVISRDFKKYQKYVIPQIYYYQEYDEVRKLGFENIILTLYRMRIDPAEVLWFAKNYNLFAVTMALEVARSSRLASLLARNNTRVYVHTVNDSKTFDALREMGVFGIYTDFVAPP
jgi:glycerophosphoryl diester phosphodiesterase